MEVSIVTVMVFALATFTLGYELGVTAGVERFKKAIDVLKKDG